MKLVAGLCLAASLGCGGVAPKVEIATTTTTVGRAREVRHVRWMARRNHVLRYQLLHELWAAR